jgi:putative ABC transport system permease protein
MERLMTSQQLEEALGELDDLHASWVERFGPVEAGRRHRREAMRYPLHLVAERLGSVRLPDVGYLFIAAGRRVRSLARAPLLSSSIVLTLGVGIGGCTALFAVADVLVLRPLPYADAERLVWIYTDSPPYRFNFSVADLQALQEEQHSFEHVGALRLVSRTFTSGDGELGEVERLSVWEVTPGFLEVLGLAPVVGRTAAGEESLAGAPGTVVVGASFASTRLGIDGDLGAAVGATIELDDLPYRVIGVLPERLGPMAPSSEVFVTQRIEPPTRKGPFDQIVLGKLASGVDRTAAEAELGAINDRLFPVWQDSYEDEEASWATAPLTELLHADAERLVFLLAGSLGLLLVLATANAGTLLLSRVRSRARELAVRVALGSSRARVVASLLFESLLLAAAGAAVAWPLAGGVLGALPTVAGSYLPRLDEVGLGGRALVFAGFLVVLAATFLCIVSSLQASAGRTDVELRSGGRTATRSRRDQRAQRVLVGAQIALAVPLLFGAGLLGSSLWNLERVNPGFDPNGLLTARVSLAEGRYPDGDAQRAFWHGLEERLAGLPGVLAVGISDARPPVEAYNYNNFDLEQRPTPPGESQPIAVFVSADAGYLEALGMPLLEGRMLTREDETAAEAPVIVVDEQWARRYFPGESAVGKRLREGGSTEGPWITVVGVVGNVPYAGLAAEADGTVYAPWTDQAEPFVVARVAGDPGALVGPLRAELARLDPTAPLTEIETGESLLGASLAEPRHLTILLTLFAAVAILLAAVGLFGITAHWVQSRRGDIAVRLALGGTPSRVLHTVVGNAMAISLGGLLVGALAAPAFARLLERTLYGVDGSSPAILVGVVALLAAVSATACALPARRIVRTNPGTALREE